MSHQQPQPFNMAEPVEGPAQQPQNQQQNQQQQPALALNPVAGIDAAADQDAAAVPPEDMELEQQQQQEEEEEEADHQFEAELMLDHEFEVDEEEEADFWEEEEDEAMEEEFDPEFEDGSEAGSDIDFSDDMDFDDAHEHLSVRLRLQLECGVLQHDASLLTSLSPTRHPGVCSSSHHHQTADALTHLPAPTAPQASAAAAGADRTSAAAAGGMLAAACGGVSGGVSVLPAEDVVVSHKDYLDIYRLEAGKPAKLMARARTRFKHYSIAASPCGGYVAATGNSGLLSLFRVQRSNPDKTPPAADAAAVPAATAGHGPSQQQQQQQQQQSEGDEAQQLDWQLIHVATLLCKNGRETMVNSVRFGHFAGQLRMLVAHQDGMLYLFNLPGEQHGTTASSSTGMAPAAAAAGSAAARAGEAAALMIQEVPSWDPLGSQINRRFVEQLMALLPPTHTGHSGTAAAAPTAGAASQIQQMQQHLQHLQQFSAVSASMLGMLGAAGTPGPAAAAAEAGMPSASGPDRAAEGQQGNTEQHPAAAAAAGSLQHALDAISQAEEVLSLLITWMHLVSRQKEVLTCYTHYSNALDLQTRAKYAEQEAKQQQQGPQAAAAPVPQPLQTQPIRLLPSHLASSMYGGRQVVEQYSTWSARAAVVGQLLQDEIALKELQIMQRYRLSFNRSDTMPLARWLAILGQWAPAVDALRAAAAGQWALLGAVGPREQQQQWQRQQQEGDEGREEALARAVYLLLLLRVLAPITKPSIKQGARVVVLRHGPDAHTRRWTPPEVSAAPRLTTCAITGIARDEKAVSAARAALDLAQDHYQHMLQVPQGPEAVGAAAIAAEEAARAAAQDHLLPLNITEASPDGQWLAVGADQLAVVLLPSGHGYQQRPCHVLDLCPTKGPTPSTGWLMHQGSLGCQYLSFNSSSTLLAASCDALRMVVVWGVAGTNLGQRLASFTLHNRPVLPLRFTPPHHTLTALRQGLEAAEAAAAAVGGGVSAAGVLQLHAGPTAAAGRMGGGGGVCDRTLAYCELNGGLHLADMSVFYTHSSVPGSPPPDPSTPTSSHFCLKTYLELSPLRRAPAGTAAAAGVQEGPAGAEAPAPQPAAAAAAAEGPGEQQQQQQGVVDADMAEAHPQQPAAAAAAAGGGEQPAAAAASGGVVYDFNQAPRINGLVVTPGGRVMVAGTRELLEWQLVTHWSHSNHSLFPAAFKSAIKTLLMAASHNPTSPFTAADSTAATGASSTQQQQLQQQVAPLISLLPGPVLDAVIEAVALPQASWAAAVLPSYSQLHAALEKRPTPLQPEDQGFVPLGGPGFMAGAPFIPWQQLGQIHPQVAQELMQLQQMILQQQGDDDDEEEEQGQP